MCCVVNACFDCLLETEPKTRAVQARALCLTCTPQSLVRAFSEVWPWAQISATHTMLNICNLWIYDIFPAMILKVIHTLRSLVDAYHEFDAGELWIQIQCGLHSEYQVPPCLKNSSNKMKCSLLYAPVCTTVFFMAGYLQHGKNSWPERHNWGISVEQICSALSEVKRKPEIWTLRNTTGSDLM